MVNQLFLWPCSIAILVYRRVLSLLTSSLLGRAPKESAAEVRTEERPVDRCDFRWHKHQTPRGPNGTWNWWSLFIIVVFMHLWIIHVYVYKKYMCMCVCICIQWKYIYVSRCIAMYLYVRISICLSIYASMPPSISDYAYISTYIYVYMYVSI